MGHFQPACSEVLPSEPDTNEEFHVTHFTARVKFRDSTFIFQLYMREWYNFSETLGHPNTTLRPGALERLPPEIRFMIYDILMPRKIHCFGLAGRPDLSFPRTAHVCREMRQYAMQKYRLIQWIQEIDGKDRVGGFGVFNPERDSIRIYDYLVDATVQWDDAFQTPKSTHISSRTKRYPIEGGLRQYWVGPEGEMWEIKGAYPTLLEIRTLL
ncbi:hypothetical protein F4679DRAFT_561047 [Xylaria curta]|nr:hypothetical protein F4679DRAFT_561047 [Xylaria curta]